jgi:DNA polymerase-3 subunit epsilon
MAIILHDGNRITETYTTLVNPGKEIPPFISRLTGITNDMVATAPNFSDIADEVMSLLENRVFVAHNVMFDYSFLTHQLEKSGYKSEHKLFCTCHSGRKLLPGHPSYSLGKLCRSLGIDLKGAHRAEADARATVSLLEMMLERTNGILADFYQEKYKRSNHSSIPEEQLNNLPSKAGVLYFRDEKGGIIFITASKNIRKKAWAIVSRFKNNRFAALARASFSLDHIVTGGNIMAAILESQEILIHAPRLNRKSGFREKRFSVYCLMNDNGYLELATGLFDLSKQPVVTYQSSAEANRELKKVMKETGLQIIAEDSPQMQLTEDAQSHNERIEAAIDLLQSRKKNFIITEKGNQEGELTAIIVRDATYTGFARISSGEHLLTFEQIQERVQYADDSPAVINSISRLIGKGEYLKIIHFS